jgi:hypothetical protein
MFLRRMEETEKGDASTPKAHLNPYIPIFHVDVICGISKPSNGAKLLKPANKTRLRKIV